MPKPKSKRVQRAIVAFGIKGTKIQCINNSTYKTWKGAQRNTYRIKNSVPIFESEVSKVFQIKPPYVDEWPYIVLWDIQALAKHHLSLPEVVGDLIFVGLIMKS